MGAELVASRRERILAAAEAEFAAHGLAGARVERIAAAAAVNKQLLFHYFDSKAGLHKAVADAVASRSAIALPSGKTPAERLRNLTDQLLRAARGYGTLLSDEWRARATGAARSIVSDGQRSGHFRDDADPDAIAEVIVAATLGKGTTGLDSQRADAGQARFAGSLVQMVTDHCSWR